MYSEQVSPQSCKSALRYIHRKGTHLVQIKDRFWSTNRTFEVAYKWCCFDKCSSVTNFLVEQGHIFTMDGDTIATDLGDVGACRAADGQCSTDEGVIIWRSKN